MKTEPQRGEAAVVSDVKAGSIVLVGPAGDVALQWGFGEADAARGLPTGEYRVRTTRVEREQEGVHWFLSSTSPPQAPLQLTADRPTRIDVDPAVHFKAQVKRHGKKLQLGFGIMGADKRGLSVYRDDKRVHVTYRVLSAKGRVLAKGNMNYG